MADQPWTDPAFRKAERRRVLLASLLPGPPQAFARRGTPQLVAVALLHAVLVLAVGLAVVRVVSGQWLPSYAGLVVLGVAVASQFASRAVNSR